MRPQTIARLLLPFLPALAMASGLGGRPRTLGGEGSLPGYRDFSLSSLSTGLRAARSAGSLPDGPDTLEIYAFLVEFAQETSDNSNTTGDGTFGSDTKRSYALEPAANRSASTRAHFLRVLEFQSQYWRKVSGGRVVVRYRVFPEADGAAPYRLARTMGQYHPASSSGGETTAQFDSTQNTRLMEMVADASRLAAADASGPFADSLPAGSRRHRVFAMIHAGASSLSDGGLDGSSAADTPSDLFDFLATPADFRYLADTGRVTETTYRADTAGLALGLPGADTLDQLMVVSETGSQDGLNFGIHGVVASQIGSVLGLPDTYDWVRGYSAVGGFCLMDFAGYTGGFDFLPVLPSAWLRLYMGWATPVVASVGNASTYRLPPVRQGSDTVLVIPLDDEEYLLVENRPRTGRNGKVNILRGDLLAGDTSTVQVAADSVSSLFLDTLCSKGVCKPNARRLSGYVLGADADAGLPGSGLLVWKVDDWLVRQFLASNQLNVWRGDTLKERYRAISLVEADGVPTLGQKFYNSAGEAVFDYGTGADLLPHVSRQDDASRDTILAIGPSGYASTQVLSGASTRLVLATRWPASAVAEPGTDFYGDSVWNAGSDSALSVTLRWAAPRDTLGEFPVRLPPTRGEAALLPGPFSGSTWVLDTLGRPQLIDSLGAPAYARPDTLRIWQGYDSVPTLIVTAASVDTLLLPLQRVGSGLGAPQGSALLGDTLVVRNAGGEAAFLWPTGAWSDSLGGTPTVASRRVAGSFASGPLVSGGRAWFGDAAGRLIGLSAAGGDTLRFATGLGALQGLAEWGGGLVAVDAAGRLARLDTVSGTVTTADPALSPVAGEIFQAAVADFDRDGVEDVAVLGSFGTATLVRLDSLVPLEGWPRRFARGASGVGECGGPAVADLDGNGTPDLLFAGRDALWAVGYDGVPLQGWPATLAGTDVVGSATAAASHPAGWVGTTPLAVDLDGDDVLELAVGTPDAEIEAFVADADAYTEDDAAVAGTASTAVWTSSVWPLSSGGRSLDTARSASLPILLRATGSGVRLHALSGLSSLDGFRLASAGRVSWGLPGADARRSFRFSDTASLGAAPEAERRVSAFLVYPSPVRGKAATFRWTLGAEASRVSLDVFDQTGFKVFERSGLPAATGTRELALQGLLWGSGVYAARLEVDWAGGGSSTVWTRFGVIR